MPVKKQFRNLRERVDQFHLMELPGQPPTMHMDTSYLVTDLWRKVKEQEEELQAYRERYGEIA